MKMNTKKTIRILAALMFAVCIIFALSSCGGGGNTGCAHTMTKTAAKAATCDQDGNIEYYTCSTCNKVFADAAGTTETTLAKTVVAKTGHKAGAEATCTTAQICTVCNAELAAAKGHTVGDWTAEVPAVGCEKAGTLGYYTCSVCEKNLAEDKTTVLEDLVIPAAAHDLSDIAAQDPTTCIDGYTAGKMCANCDYTEGMEVIPAEHAYGAVQPGAPATCLLPGYKDYQICSACNTTVGGETINPLGHDLQPVDAKEKTCYTDGYSAHEKCSRCYYTKDKIVYPAGHTGEWVADGNYEYIVCTIDSCGRKAVREKNAVINFEGGSILANDKLAITDVAAGAIEGGNARDKFTLVDDASNKVLQVINSKENAGAATAGKITLNYTDADNTVVTGGKYLVTEFDVKFDFATGNNSSDLMFALQVWDSGNYLCSINFYSYGQKLKTNTTELDYVADGTTWLTFRAVTELKANDSETCTTKLYYKHRDSDGAMIYLTSGAPAGPSYGGASRTGGHTAILKIDKNNYDYTYYLDNMSFIRTADTNYLYGACDHNISEIVTPANCTDDTVITRKCTAAGCGYTTTETLPGTATGHKLSAWTYIAVDEQQSVCENTGCDLAVTREALPAGSVQFDDGTLTSGGKLTYSDNANVTAGATTATSNGDYATLSTVTAPGRDGEIALRVQVVTANYVSGRASTITVPTIGTEGNYYTLDFDLYVDDAANANSTLAVFQMNFGSAAINLNSYGNSVQLGSGASGVEKLGNMKQWISVRFVFEVTADGSANYVAYAKDANGEYAQVKTGTLANNSIKLDTATAFSISTYAGKDRDYYLDNISYTRSACAHTFGEWEGTLPTCLVDGSRSRTCSVCEAVQTEVIDALGHTGEWVVDGDNEKLACTTCGHIVTREKNTPVDFDGENIADEKFVFTDALHTVNDGNYLVFDFDITFDALEVVTSSVSVFNLRLFDGQGGNTLADFIFNSYQGKIKIGDGAYVVDANDKYVGVWFTFRAVTELADGAEGTYVTKLYYKVKGDDSAFKLLATASHSNENGYGSNTRTEHYYKFVPNTSNDTCNYELKNLSFIRTADENYTYSACDHKLAVTAKTDATCTENGTLTLSCTVDGCGYTVTEAIPAGHKLSAWTDIANGLMEKQTCANCGYSVNRAKNQVTFDDGTLGGLTYSANANANTGANNAVSTGDYATLSVVAAPDKDNDKALHVQTVLANYTVANTPKIIVSATGTEGNVYVFDFDVYATPADTLGTSRAIFEVLFGGSKINIATYGTTIRIYDTQIVLGKINAWNSIRLVYTVSADGAASLELLTKEGGIYVSKTTLDMTGADIKLDGVSAVELFTYSSGSDADYYLDNISLVRTASAAE